MGAQIFLYKLFYKNFTQDSKFSYWTGKAIFRTSVKQFISRLIVNTDFFQRKEFLCPNKYGISKKSPVPHTQKRPLKRGRFKRLALKLLLFFRSRRSRLGRHRHKAGRGSVECALLGGKPIICLPKRLAVGTKNSLG